MRIFSLIDRLKTKNIVFLTVILLVLYLGLNLLPMPSSAHELLNSLYSTLLSLFSCFYVFVLYRLSKQSQLAISKPLFWLSLSFLSWFLADFLWLWLIAINKDPFPSPADLFYFAIYPTLFIAIFKIPSTLSPARGIKRISIEISILVLTAILFFFFLVVIPGKSINEYDSFSLFILYLYPALDFVLIWVILILFYSNQLRSSKRMMSYFIVGIICFTISDLLYFTNTIFNIEDQGYYIDLGYYIFYFIILIASLKGYNEVRITALPVENDSVINLSNKWMSFLPAVFLITVIGFILFFVFNLFSLHNVIAGVIVAVIFILFIIHQYLVVSENISLSRQMNKINIDLERKVMQRTIELDIANKELQAEINYRRTTEEILKQSEEKYRLIAENTSDVIWVLDFNLLKFTYVSPSVINLLNYSAAEILDKNLDDLLVPQSLIDVMSKLEKRIEGFYAGDKSEMVSIDEVKQICKDGRIIWVEVATTLITDSNGRVESIIGVSRNIEQRKKAELLISQKNDKLEELNATKDKFFSIIAHDLKSPFCSIVNFSDILSSNIDELSKDKIRSFAGAINNSAKLTFKLLENLLEWSQLQRGKIEPNLKYYNLKSIVDEVVQLNNESAASKQIAIQVNIAPNIFAFCDIEITKTIFRNLISNSLKFTKNNGFVAIDLVKNDSLAEIQILDTGVGIQPEKIPFLFSIEQDISTTGTANEKGTGLGLLICKELIEKQGGEIWVDSEVGKGTTFYFTIRYKEITSPET